MAESPQNYSNHGRYDPLFHFFILPVFAITLIGAIVCLVKRPGLHSAWLVVFMVALLTAVFKIRLYSLKVQDRVIRLEERMRLATLLDPALRSAHPRVQGVPVDRPALRIRCRTPRASRTRPERKTLFRRYQKINPKLAPRQLESLSTSTI